MFPTVRTSLAGVLAMAVAGACGGAAELITPQGDAGSGQDSPPATFCPVVPPTVGAACNKPVGLQCEYGNAPTPECNRVFGCPSSGAWQDESGTSPGGCTLPDASSACPASYAGVPVRMFCTPNQLACPYPQGTCYCTQSFGGPISLTPAWDCVPTPAGCPTERPHLGDPCSEVAQSCDYGACVGGAAVVCESGFWKSALISCPV